MRHMKLQYERDDIILMSAEVVSSLHLLTNAANSVCPYLFQEVFWSKTAKAHQWHCAHCHTLLAMACTYTTTTQNRPLWSYDSVVVCCAKSAYSSSCIILYCNKYLTHIWSKSPQNTSACVVVCGVSTGATAFKRAKQHFSGACQNAMRCSIKS